MMWVLTPHFRRQILRLLACLTLSVQGVARALDLDPNEARAFLRRLCVAGLVEVAPLFPLVRHCLGLSRAVFYRTVLTTNRWTA